MREVIRTLTGNRYFEVWKDGKPRILIIDVDLRRVLFVRASLTKDKKFLITKKFGTFKRATNYAVIKNVRKQYASCPLNATLTHEEVFGRRLVGGEGGRAT